MSARWLHAFAQRAWYPRTRPASFWLDPVAAMISLVLAPAGWLVAAVARRRRATRQASAPGLPPIIVVGNLVAGGAGKTPLVIALAQALLTQGVSVGVICRGHRGSATADAMEVKPDTDPELAGDEAVLLARSCECPVIACKNRLAASRALVERHSPAIIISDDGLQHAALPRAFEFVVVDARTRFGNGRCLPAGPLREPADAEALTESADRRCFVLRGTSEDAAGAAAGLGLRAPVRMRLEPAKLYPLGETMQNGPQLGWLDGRRLHAVCGIGRPEQFFASLANLGADVVEHAFADHHQYSGSDLDFGDELPVVLTAKDAVKCERLDFASRQHTYVLGVAPSFDRDPLALLGPFLGRSLASASPSLS